jgi:hypothetical protein
MELANGGYLATWKLCRGLDSSNKNEEVGFRPRQERVRSSFVFATH